MNVNERVAIRVFALWAIALGLTVLTLLASRSWVIRAGQTFVEAAGPGNSDYAMDIIGDFALFRRSRNARSVISKTSGSSWVDEDVTRLGWDSRFIVCCQGSSWWIIDAAVPAKHGPFDEPGCAAKLRDLGVEPPQVYPTPDGRGSPVNFGPEELHQRKLE